MRTTRNGPDPDSGKHLDKDIHFHKQDCSKPWEIAPCSLDVIFSSNFFEHLPDKEALDKTVAHAKTALKPGGLLIALGSNISVLNSRYWDFWDHHVALSDQSIGELLEIHKLKVVSSVPSFLPYNMVRNKRRPLFLLQLYLMLPVIWRVFRKQFQIVAKK